MAQEDIIANPASDRCRGWDYLLEIPLVPAQKRSDESRSSEDCQCFVQVKSTRATVNSWPIELSNWKRLAETPLPAFFLLLRFDAADGCVAAYLRHVWQQEIAALDDRIWKLALSKKPLLLHKHTMALKWSESDRLSQPSGGALRKRILQLVGSSPTDYAARKAGVKNSSGHNIGRGRLTVRIPVPDRYRHRHPDEFLVDTLLGLTPFPPVIDGEMTHVEFRVPKSTTQTVQAGARVAVGPGKPAEGGELALATRDREREVILPAEVRGPTGLARPVDPSAWKVLFTVPFAQFVFSVGDKTGTFYFALPGREDAQPLSKCVHLANLLKFLAEADTPVTVSFNGSHWGTLDLRGGGIQEDFLAWARMVQVAQAACTMFGFPLETSITTGSLLEQRSALDLLAVALPGCLARDPAFTFSLREGKPRTSTWGPRCASPSTLT